MLREGDTGSIKQNIEAFRNLKGGVINKGSVGVEDNLDIPEKCCGPTILLLFVTWPKKLP